ncbi:hypothetical protein [Streptomyces californicus]
MQSAVNGLQTAPALSHRCTTHKEIDQMNFLTNLLAGVVHFVGWLV